MDFWRKMPETEHGQSCSPEKPEEATENGEKAPEFFGADARADKQRSQRFLARQKLLEEQKRALFAKLDARLDISQLVGPQKPRFSHCLRLNLKIFVRPKTVCLFPFSCSLHTGLLLTIIFSSEVVVCG